ncbi:unnamed protein product [Vitrella brassicaformis CCMP3155]|uniref:USP domain-containing protein n=2 Tax=Vitrella brassicaformis TaxID=1169539 RepID=A0A0G4EL34_VITBC|nr:unnamed protein product [Vitrella brassicaformis CCMP3155]|eukprot:CEL97896.1 unnamed protein product [Vitrella brassicaformis CCMP3155]
MWSIFNLKAVRKRLTRSDGTEASPTLQKLKEAFLTIDKAPSLTPACPPLFDLTGLLVHLENALETSEYHVDVRSQQDTAETCTALLHLIDSEEAAAGVASNQRFDALIGSSFVSQLMCSHCCDDTGREESQRMVSLGISHAMNAFREWGLMELVEETTLKPELMEAAAGCPTCGRRRYKRLYFDLPGDVLPFAVKRNQIVYNNNGDIDRQYPSPLPIHLPMTLTLPSTIGPLTYRLSSAQLHHPEQDREGNATAEAGHYTTILRCLEDGPASGDGGGSSNSSNSGSGSSYWALTNDAAPPRIMTQQEATAFLSSQETQSRVCVAWYERDETESDGACAVPLSRGEREGGERGGNSNSGGNSKGMPHARHHYGVPYTYTDEELFPALRPYPGLPRVIYPPFPPPPNNPKKPSHKKATRPQLVRPMTTEKPKVDYMASLGKSLTKLVKAMFPPRQPNFKLPPPEVLFPPPRPYPGGPVVMVGETVLPLVVPVRAGVLPTYHVSTLSPVMVR